MIGAARRAAAAALLAATACTHAYRPPALPEERTALVRIETHAAAFAKIEFLTTFYMHARDYGTDGCPGKRSYGGTYLGEIDIERENGSAEIRVRAGTRIFFIVLQSAGTLGGSVSCDLTYGFVPEEGHRYRVRHAANRRRCEASVHDETANAPVVLMGSADCPTNL